MPGSVGQLPSDLSLSGGQSIRRNASDTAFEAFTPGGGSAAWGGITGTLADQTDLQSALSGKASTTHTHAISDTTGLQAALDAKAPLSAPTFSGDITSTGTTILLDSAGTATHAIDRGAITNFANFVYRTAGADQWSLGLRNDSTNNLYIRDNVNAVNILQAALGATPAVTAGGAWTFSNDVTVPDEAYGAGWNGSNEAPTKNAVYDKINSMFTGTANITVGTSAPGSPAVGDIWIDTN